MSPHPPDDPTRLEQRLADLERQLAALTSRLDFLEQEKRPSQTRSSTSRDDAPVSPEVPASGLRNEPPPLPPPPSLDPLPSREPDPIPELLVEQDLPAANQAGEADHAPELQPVSPNLDAEPVWVMEPTAAAAEPSPAESGPSVAESDWRDLLRRLRILPPERREGENLEMEIGRWWFSRIGILFAVAGAVFFAIYVSQFTSPLQRLASLCAVSCGVVGLGWWLERRMPQFGAVIFAGGLALLYFASWASHGVAAVKVFEDPWPSLLWQFATVGAIIGCGTWRRRATVATMATALGFVTSFLSVMDDRGLMALGAGAALGAASVGFLMWRGWLRPLIVSVPLSFGLFAFCVFRDSGAPLWPAAEQVWVWLMGFMLLYGLADALSLWRGIAIPAQARRALFILNSSAGVLLGYFFTSRLYPDQLDVFYFLFGGVLLAASLGYYFARHRDALMHAYFIKATGLLTLGLIEIGDARTRWIALLVESAILLISAHQSRLKTTEAASGIVWVLSLGFFYWFVVSNYVPVAGSPASRDAWLGLAWVTGSAALLGVWARRFPAWIVQSRDGVIYRGIAQAGSGILLGVGACAWAWGFLPRETWWPAGAGGLALGLAVAALLCRHWLGLIAAGIVLAHANLQYWLDDPGSLSLSWVNAAVLAILGFGSALAHGVWSPRRPRWDDGRTAGAIDALLHFGWMMSLQVAAWRAWPWEVYLLAMTALALAAALLSRLRPLRRMRDLTALPLCVAIGGLIASMVQFGQAGLLPTAEPLWLWGVIAGVWVFAAGQDVVLGWMRRPSSPGADGAKAAPESNQRNGRAEALHVLLAAVFTLVGLFEIFSLPELTAVVGMAMLAIAGLGRATGIRSTFGAAVVYFAMAHLLAMLSMRAFGPATATTVETMAWVLGMEALALVFLALAGWWRGGGLWRREAGETGLPDGGVMALQWAGGLVVVFTLFRLFYVMPGAWQNYISVCWGVSAICVMAAGFAGRARPLRLVGIGALAITSVRVCLVDIQSMIYRIAAFIALGVVMLMVAFLYHRFSAILAKWEGDGKHE